MTKDIFLKESTDEIYNNIRNETLSWHPAAKEYWQQLYNQHSSFLDKGFHKKISREFFSRLWELTQVNYITQHVGKGVNLEKMYGKVSKPDFCFNCQDKRFWFYVVLSG